MHTQKFPARVINKTHAQDARDPIPDSWPDGGTPDVDVPFTTSVVGCGTRVLGEDDRQIVGRIRRDCKSVVSLRPVMRYTVEVPF